MSGLDIYQVNESKFRGNTDVGDGCWAWKRAHNSRGYGMAWANKNGKNIWTLAHRVSFALANGSVPSEMHVDHICHNPGCVRPDHLRAVTRKQNMENRKGADAGNSTGIRGVTLDRGKFCARVTHDNETYYLGRFDDARDAEKAVLAKRNEFFTHNDMDRKAS
jgi:hypothetical protein